MSIQSPHLPMPDWDRTITQVHRYRKFLRRLVRYLQYSQMWSLFLRVSNRITTRNFQTLKQQKVPAGWIVSWRGASTTLNTNSIIRASHA